MDTPHDYDPFRSFANIIPFRGSGAQPRAGEKMVTFYMHMWLFEIVNVFTTMCVLGVAKSVAYEFLKKEYRLGRLQIVDNVDQASTVYMLTANGAEFTRPFVGAFERKWEPKIHPSRLVAKNENHDLIASWRITQLCQALLLKEGGDRSRIRVMNSNMLRSQAGKGDTQADAGIKHLDTGTSIELEVQESYANDMARRLSRICERLKAGGLSECYVVSTKPRVLDFYKSEVSNPGFSPYWYHPGLTNWFPNKSKPSPYTPEVAAHLTFDLVKERPRFYKHPLRSDAQSCPPLVP